MGDFEIDLVIGKVHNEALITANDRVSAMVKIAIIDSKDSEIVSNEVVRMLYEFKSILKTITSDNIKEFSDINPLQNNCVSIITLQDFIIVGKEDQMKI